MEKPVGHIPKAELEAFDARLLAHGFDTWAETHNVTLPDETWEAFEAAQRDARESNASGQDGAPIAFGASIWHMRPWGGGGAKYILANPDCTLAIRAKAMKWNVTARYSSFGLWSLGLNKLRERLYADFEREGVKRDMSQNLGEVVSRLDYAFDFECEEFTHHARPELLANFVQPQSSKAAVYTSGNGIDIRAETFRVGKLPRLQIEVYDKGREIREASGKEWMRDVWKLPEDHDLNHIWRIECRFGSEYFIDRGIRTVPAVIADLPKILANALVKRRLTMGNVTRARRSDMHPLWEMAWKASGDAQTVPAVDRRPTLARAELREIIQAQIAGLARADAVLSYGDYSDDHPEEIARIARERIAADKSHAAKVERVQERYRFIDKGK